MTKSTHYLFTLGPLAGFDDFAFDDKKQKRIRGSLLDDDGAWGNDLLFAQGEKLFRIFGRQLKLAVNHVATGIEVGGRG